MSGNYFEKIRIDQGSRTPIYKQLATEVIRGIEMGGIRVDVALPSLHDLHVRLDISRGTVEKAYRLLMQRGIVEAVHGKGFYINLGQSA